MRAARCAQLLALCMPLCQRRGDFLVHRTCSVRLNKLRQAVRAQSSHLFREQFPDAMATALLVLARRQLASDLRTPPTLCAAGAALLQGAILQDSDLKPGPRQRPAEPHP